MVEYEDFDFEKLRNLFNQFEELKKIEPSELFPEEIINEAELKLHKKIFKEINKKDFGLEKLKDLQREVKFLRRQLTKKNTELRIALRNKK